MSRFALSCLAFLALAALVVETKPYKPSPWEEVERYAKINHDVHGQRIWVWYDEEFKEADGERHNDVEVRDVLAFIVYHLKVSEPEDCDEEHLMSFSKFEKIAMEDDEGYEGLKYYNLNKIFTKVSREYSEVCQMRVSDEFKRVVKTMNPAQFELVNKFTKKMMEQDNRADEYRYMINGLHSDMIRDGYLKMKPNYAGIDKNALAGACKAYITTISPVYKPLETYLRVITYSYFTKVFRVEEQRIGYVSKVFCETFLREENLV